MSDRPGDPAKRTEDCRIATSNRCPNLNDVSSPTDMSGETYECTVCGEKFRLYYEDMA